MGTTNINYGVSNSSTGAQHRTMLEGWADSKVFQKLLSAYVPSATRLWNHLPHAWRDAYGRHLHTLVRLRGDRKQFFATFFLRNRPELELIRRIVDQAPRRSALDLSVLACSKGAEVYSILWAIRRARPDIRVRVQALDISQEIVDFAARGMYSLRSVDIANPPEHFGDTELGNITWNTWRDQGAPIFERMTREEIGEMFEVKGDDAKVRPFLKEGISWRCADACDPNLAKTLGLQDIVVANRFLCHMDPPAAEKCLRNIAHLVKPGGYLFVSGIDLDVRARVARDLNWKPVVDLVKEIHEGDPSLTYGWPWAYWGLEPFTDTRPDWKVRYASVFQIGDKAVTEAYLTASTDHAV